VRDVQSGSIEIPVASGVPTIDELLAEQSAEGESRTRTKWTTSTADGRATQPFWSLADRRMVRLLVQEHWLASVQPRRWTTGYMCA